LKRPAVSAGEMDNITCLNGKKKLSIFKAFIKNEMHIIDFK